jgi:RimJ/RimL family protein N-acetyltransferase
MLALYFNKVDTSELTDLRSKYLNDLKGPVLDAFEESIETYNADFVRIAQGSQTIGYACIGTHGDFNGYILEYYIIGSHRTDAGSIIMKLAAQYHCKGWYVNTHDHFALPVMIGLRLRYEIDAYTFAIDSGADWLLEKNITVETTQPTELQEAYALVMQDGFYTGGGIEALASCIQGGEVYSLRTCGRLAGIGFVTAMSRTPAYAEIAMIIDKAERQNGLGVLLVKALIHQSLLPGLIPAAVCDVRNTASRKTLEKAGFYLNGCILAANF